MIRVYVYGCDGDRFALVRGNARDWLAGHVPARRDNIAAGWWVTRERVSDMLAALEREGYAVAYRDGMPPPPRRRGAA